MTEDKVLYNPPILTLSFSYVTVHSFPSWKSRTQITQCCLWWSLGLEGTSGSHLISCNRRSNSTESLSGTDACSQVVWCSASTNALGSGTAKAISEPHCSNRWKPLLRSAVHVPSSFHVNFKTLYVNSSVKQSNPSRRVLHFAGRCTKILLAAKRGVYLMGPESIWS